MALATRVSRSPAWTDRPHPHVFVAAAREFQGACRPNDVPHAELFAMLPGSDPRDRTALPDRPGAAHRVPLARQAFGQSENACRRVNPRAGQVSYGSKTVVPIAARNSPNSRHVVDRQEHFRLVPSADTFREKSGRPAGTMRSYPAASSTRRITRFTEPVDTSTVKLSATHSKVVS
jgi:hypothetical protein